MIFFVSGSKKEVIALNKNERALNKLKSVVDKDVYLTLLVTFAGETIYFPAAGTPKEKQERNREIIKAKENGVSVSELIESYGLSESQIRRILKGKEV